MEYACAAQRLLLLVALGLFVLPLTVARRPLGAPHAPAALVRFGEVVGAGFLLLALWQSYWVLLPAASPGFRGAERYDARGWRLRTVDDRRGVVDRRGVPLVRNEVAAGRVLRRYPLGPAAAHVTGYHHRRYGQAGIESACNAELSTWRRPAWRVLGRAGRPGNVVTAPLRLTLDARLQVAAAQALGRRRGAVVVLQPVTGEVLALVSTPAYDPETLSAVDFQPSGPDGHNPLFNRALDGLYPPGSTFKPLVAAAALGAGYGLATVHETPAEGFVPPGDSLPIKDHEASDYAKQGLDWLGHGSLDMRGAMACSANGYFAWLGCQLGAEALLAAGRSCGLDESWSLIRGPSRALACRPGHLPERLTTGAALARAAIGQDDVLVTPLHLALLAATIANDGVLRPPYVVGGEGPGTGRQVMTPELGRQVRGLMRCVVTDSRGTGRGLRLPGLPVAAKTGSAENSAGEPHSLVIALAPYDRPRLALAVVVEHGGQGSRAAVPVARAVLRAAAREGGL
jgi:peptidoglycan glycosyltransferase